MSSKEPHWSVALLCFYIVNIPFAIFCHLGNRYWGVHYGGKIVLYSPELCWRETLWTLALGPVGLLYNLVGTLNVILTQIKIFIDNNAGMLP